MCNPQCARGRGLHVMTSYWLCRFRRCCRYGVFGLVTVCTQARVGVNTKHKYTVCIQIESAVQYQGICLLCVTCAIVIIKQIIPNCTRREHMHTCRTHNFWNFCAAVLSGSLRSQAGVPRALNTCWCIYYSGSPKRRSRDRLRWLRTHYKVCVMEVIMMMAM